MNKGTELSPGKHCPETAEMTERHVILLVEEETHERVFIAGHLIEAGFGVLQAESSDAALTLLESRAEISGVVTDAHVPGRVDGFELARVVRERWPERAVVLMSGHSDATSGPVPDGGEFIAKPHLMAHLASTLWAMLAKRSA